MLDIDLLEGDLTKSRVLIVNFKTTTHLMVSMTHREVTHLGIDKIDLLNVVP